MSAHALDQPSAQKQGSVYSSTYSEVRPHLEVDPLQLIALPPTGTVIVASL
jgi:hypothetical protein